MKITDVQLHQYRWERGTPIRNGMHTYTHSGLNLLQIHTDSGHTGIGWAHKPQTLGMAKVVQGLLEHFKPLLIGEDPFNYRRIWQALWLPKLVGRRGITTRFISGVDIALWDLMGKATGQVDSQAAGGGAGTRARLYRRRILWRRQGAGGLGG